MDIATFIGVIGSFALIIVSILISPGGSLGAFIDYPSVAMVIGGGTMAVLVSVPFGRVLSVAKVVMKSFFVKNPDVKKLIKTIVEFAVVARRDGLLARSKARSRAKRIRLLPTASGLSLKGPIPSSSKN